MTLDEYLKTVEKRCEAATEGPWVVVDNGFDGYIKPPEHTDQYLICGGQRNEGYIGKDEPNTQFIAHARTDVPVLLEMLDWLIGETRIGLNDKQEKYMIEKLEALVPGANGRGSDAN